MRALGFVDGDPLWEYMQAMFAQDLVPDVLLAAKEATKVAQVTNFDLGDAGPAAAGNYTITINGEDYTHVSPGGETRAQVITALIALFPGGQPVTAAPGGDAEQLDVTADQAGIGFASATASPGVA